MAEWIDVVHGIKWDPHWRDLGGPVHLVNSDGESILANCLAELGVEVFTIEGHDVRDKDSLFEQISVVFGFPDYFGKNWDAFDECFHDFCRARTAPLAILWRNTDAMLDSVLSLLLQSVMVFALDARGAVGKDGSPLLVEIFWLGPPSRGFVAMPVAVQK